MSSGLDYNMPGHVCPTTGRIAMKVADAYAREDCPDRRFFAYSIEAAEMGLECWRMIEGIDAENTDGGIKPAKYWLDWSMGGDTSVTPGCPVYLQPKIERS